MTDMTDRPAEELLPLARRDGQNLGPLLDAYRNYLTMLAQLQMDERLQGKLDASDLVQESFLEAHRHFDRFRGKSEGELLSWLRSILASRVTAAMKRFYGAKRRDVHLERRLGEEIDRSSQMAHNLALSQTSPSERAARRERAVLLANVLASLPPDYQQVILLRDLQELSFPEVARRMGRSAEAARKLWIRALAQLSSLLAGESNQIL